MIVPSQVTREYTRTRAHPIYERAFERGGESGCRARIGVQRL